MTHTIKYLLVLALSISAISAFTQPVSVFSSSAESWSTVGDPGSSPGATWAASGGNPGGCIKGTDESIGTWYWNSPSTGSWKGDLTTYSGCNLSFDLKQSSTAFPIPAYDIMIIRASDDAMIVYNTPYNPSTTWTSYSIPLTNVGWTWTDLDGADVTAVEFNSFLSDVKRIRIRAEFSGLGYETNFLDNAMMTCALILPVELSSFDAHAISDNSSMLEWETSSEYNCLGFQIEKSINNGLVFDSIAFIEGNGTTSISHSYSFIDKHFSASAYYRLKQIDQDFRGTYSDNVFVENNSILASASGLSINIYPNPVINQITIETSSEISSAFLTDLSGKKILDQKFALNTTSAFIDVSNISAGIYYLHILSGYSELKTLLLEIIR